MREYVVHEIIRRSLITDKDREIVSGKVRLTYTEMHSRILKLANSLKSIGITRGTVVGVLDVNTH